MATFDEVITLRKESKAYIEGEGYEKSFIDTNIFARLESITRSEFYQAQSAGFKPELKFVIADFLDYDGQEVLIHEGKQYKILRTYRKDRGLEITVYGGVNNADS